MLFALDFSAAELGDEYPFTMAFFDLNDSYSAVAINTEKPMYQPSQHVTRNAVYRIPSSLAQMRSTKKLHVLLSQSVRSHNRLRRRHILHWPLFPHRCGDGQWNPRPPAGSQNFTLNAPSSQLFLQGNSIRLHIGGFLLSRECSWEVGNALGQVRERSRQDAAAC